MDINFEDEANVPKDFESNYMFTCMSMENVEQMWDHLNTCFTNEGMPQQIRKLKCIISNWEQFFSSLSSQKKDLVRKLNDVLTTTTDSTLVEIAELIKTAKEWPIIWKQMRVLKKMTISSTNTQSSVTEKMFSVVFSNCFAAH